MRRLIPLLLLLAAAAAFAQDAGDYDRAIQAQKRQLDELKRQAEETWRKAKQVQDEEKGVLQRLKKAEQALEASRNYIQGLQQREAILEDEIRRADRRLGDAQRSLEGRRDALRERMRHVYKHGRARSLEVLFTASSFPDLLQRSAFLGRVLQQDRKLVTQVETHQTEVQESLAALKAKRAEIHALRGEKDSETRRYEQAKAQRERELQGLRGKRSEHEAAARELERSAEQMQAVLAELERRRQEALRNDNPVVAELDRVDFRRNRGRLPWPVRGTVIGEYGRHVNPKYNTVTRNNGVDIQAPMGTGVICVADGVVEMVQWLSGYGQSIIVNHGRGYYSIYAHLSAVQVGQGERVSPGQVIGAVGDSGSLKGANLHFEIRNGSEAEDPRSWLRP